MSCYLDMDGLLVNLFDHVANKMHGKRYQHLSEEEKTEGKTVWEDKSIFHRKFGRIDEFFANLAPYNTNDALLETVIEKFGSFYICSKPTKLGAQACIAGKLSWIEEHLLPKYQNNIKGILFPEKKEIFAIGKNNTPNILIDDYKPYIEAWNNAGGVGIRIRSDRFESKKEISAFLRYQFQEIENNLERQSKVGKIGKMGKMGKVGKMKTRKEDLANLVSNDIL